MENDCYDCQKWLECTPIMKMKVEVSPKKCIAKKSDRSEPSTKSDGDDDIGNMLNDSFR